MNTTQPTTSRYQVPISLPVLALVHLSFSSMHADHPGQHTKLRLRKFYQLLELRQYHVKIKNLSAISSITNRTKSHIPSNIHLQTDVIGC